MSSFVCKKWHKVIPVLFVFICNIFYVAFLLPSVAQACNTAKSEFTCQCNGGYYCQAGGCNACNSTNNAVTTPKGQQIFNPTPAQNAGKTPTSSKYAQGVC